MTGSDNNKIASDKTRLQVTRTSRFPGGWNHGLEPESGKVTCSIFCQLTLTSRENTIAPY